MSIDDGNHREREDQAMSTATVEDSNLVRHAREEMRRAGLYDADADYGGMIPNAVEEIIATFASQGHSGASAALVTGLLGKLLRFESLTPITSDPDEWQDVSEATGQPMWQSKRVPHAFSDDGGQTWYSIEPSAATFGDRVIDGGAMGTIVRCHECGGSGQLHQLDELPPTVEPEDA